MDILEFNEEYLKLQNIPLNNLIQRYKILNTENTIKYWLFSSKVCQDF